MPYTISTPAMWARFFRPEPEEPPREPDNPPKPIPQQIWNIKSPYTTAGARLARSSHKTITMQDLIAHYLDRLQSQEFLPLGWPGESQNLRALNKKFDKGVLSIHAMGIFIHEIEEKSELTREGVKYPSKNAAMNFYLCKAQRQLEEMLTIVVDIQEAIWEIRYGRVWDVEKEDFKFGCKGAYAVKVHCDRLIEGEADEERVRNLTGTPRKRGYNSIIGS